MYDVAAACDSGDSGPFGFELSTTAVLAGWLPKRHPDRCAHVDNAQAAVMRELEAALQQAKIREAGAEGRARLHRIVEEGYEQLDALGERSRRNVEARSEALQRSLDVEADALQAQVLKGREMLHSMKESSTRTVKEIDEGRNAHLFFKSNSLSGKPSNVYYRRGGSKRSKRLREAPRTYAESRAEDAGATGALLFGLMTAFSAFYLAII